MFHFTKAGAASRNESADSLRGIAAILVITGHMLVRDAELLPDPNYLRYTLYCVHMPLFFFFAGFYARSALQGSFWELLKQKAPRLLVPYVMWSSVAVAAKAAISLLQGQWDGEQVLYTWGDTLLYARSAWFFLVLFTLFCLFWLLHWVYRKSPVAAVALAVIVYFLPISMVLALHRAQTMIPYFALGLLVRQKKTIISQFSRDHGNKLLWAALLVLAVTPLYIVQASKTRLVYGFEMLLSNCVCVLTTATVCILGEAVMKKVQPLRKMFRLFGEYSMELYCIHMMFVNFLPIPIPQKILSMPEPIVDILYLAMALVLAFMIVAASCWIFNRIPIYRWLMLGQWPRRIKSEE